MAANNTPEWVDGKKINEVLFCEDFLREYPLVSMNGTFFTVDGLVSDENLLKKKIYDFLKPYISTGLPKKVSNFLEVLQMECCTEDLPLQTDRIHVENGTLFLDGTFTPEKEFCRNRLTVSYNPDASEPVAWKAFLSQLLYPEDIPALQEYFGYCLIASNKAQKMLFVIGKGGEGKSRLGLVAQALFGCNMKTGSIVKLSQSGELDMDKIFEILREPKANQQDKISFRVDDLRKFFPKSYSVARIQEGILKLLEADFRKRQRAQER